MASSSELPVQGHAKGAGREVLSGIQLLRGLAAIFVVIDHSSSIVELPEYFDYTPWLPLGDAGTFAVAVFFVISGFIMPVVSLDRTLSPKTGVGEFVRRRFVRIVPFLWVCVIGYNLLSFLGTHSVDWGAAGRAMALWPIGSIKPNIVWSLRHELVFYALFALGFMAVRRARWPLYGWLIAPAIVWYPLQAWRQDIVTISPALDEFLVFLLQGSTNGANLQFLGGLLLGIGYVKGHRLMRTASRGGLWLPLVLMTASTLLVVVMAAPVDLPRVALWTGMATLVCWAGVTIRVSEGGLHRFALASGAWSYSVYLVHSPVILIMIAAAKIAGIPVGTAPMMTAFLVVTIVLAIAVGALAHYLVEQPLIRAMSSRLDRWTVAAGNASGA